MVEAGPTDALWDTTLASRIHPATDVVDHIAARAARGDPVRVAAPAVLEVVYGYQLRAAADPRFRQELNWFRGLIAAEVFAVTALDGRAAVIAGQLRAESPHKARSDRRSKTMRQASWLMDIEIAATAFSGGLAVATDNRDDFEALTEVLATLYPAAPRLTVVGAPV